MYFYIELQIFIYLTGTNTTSIIDLWFMIMI